MSIIGTTQFFERIQFFNGERLFASDLQALETFNREMRWLHNQSLHQAGIGSGFAVLGKIGDRQVLISPGYALNAEGQEIILTEALTLPIPPVADNGSGGSAFYDLTVSYPLDSDLKTSEVRAGVCNCPPEGVVRLREEPVFCWVRLNDNPSNRQPVDDRLKSRIQSGMFLVLAQVEIFNCQLRQPVSTAQQRSARPPKAPYIASGFVKQPNWTQEPGGSALTTLGFTVGSPWSVTINTRSAGFQANPTYIARLVGTRVFNIPAAAGAVASSSILQDAIINIPSSSVGPDGFLLEIFPVAAFLNNSSGNTSNAPSPAWDVAWLGVEN
jgi:hypothetical protein